jgi:DNA-binding transcriptional MerR regulator
MAVRLTIGQLAQATSVAPRTIRYYEQVGVLPVPARSRAGYRQYDDRAVQRLLFIRRARALGLPLRRLQELYAAQNGGRGALRSRLLALVRQHIRTVDHRRPALRRRVVMPSAGRRRHDGG